MSDMIKNVRLDPARVDRERDVIKSELVFCGAKSSQRFNIDLVKALYPTARVCDSVPGDYESLDKIDATVLRAYYDKFYTPENMTLIICGDVNHDAALQQVQALFAALPTHQTPNNLQYDKPMRTGQFNSSFPHEPGSTIRLVYDAGDGLAVQEGHILDIIKDELYDQLKQKLRAQHGYVYHVTTSIEFYEQLQRSVFCIQIPVQPKHARAAIEVIDDTIASLIKSGIKNQTIIDYAKRKASDRLYAKPPNSTAADTLQSNLSRHEVFVPSSYEAELCNGITGSLVKETIAKIFQQPRMIASYGQRPHIWVNQRGGLVSAADLIRSAGNQRAI